MVLLVCSIILDGKIFWGASPLPQLCHFVGRVSWFYVKLLALIFWRAKLKISQDWLPWHNRCLLLQSLQLSLTSVICSHTSTTSAHSCSPTQKMFGLFMLESCVQRSWDSFIYLKIVSYVDSTSHKFPWLSSWRFLCYKKIRGLGSLPDRFITQFFPVHAQLPELFVIFWTWNSVFSQPGKNPEVWHQVAIIQVKPRGRVDTTAKIILSPFKSEVTLCTWH